MSYDISIRARIYTDVYDSNYTYNVSPMFYKALGAGGIKQLHKKKCKECIKILKRGIAAMKKHSDTYEKMNPSNGWGNYEGALKVLEDLLKACETFPNGVVNID